MCGQLVCWLCLLLPWLSGLDLLMEGKCWRDAGGPGCERQGCQAFACRWSRGGASHGTRLLGIVCVMLPYAPAATDTFSMPAGAAGGSWMARSAVGVRRRRRSVRGEMVSNLPEQVWVGGLVCWLRLLLPCAPLDG